METTIVKSPIGPIEVEHDNGCLKEIKFHSRKRVANQKNSAEVANAIRTYFSSTADLCLPFEIKGTAFERAVYLELWKTKPGETLSYQDLARRVGRPKAFRAVARTMAKNRLPLLIPCHRVINSDGKLGGFSGGLTTKRWLLKHEQSLATGPRA